jgi:hypothetical protein
MGLRIRAIWNEKQPLPYLADGAVFCFNDQFGILEARP